MPTLDDGSVIPSFLSVQDSGVPNFFSQLNNVALRLGEVKKIIYPSNNKSRSKKVIEYDVLVKHVDGSRLASSVIYKNCTISNIFGGAADLVQYTLRSDKREKDNDSIGKGSKVLLLCLNGQTSSPIIIGGVRDYFTDSTSRDSDSNGHNYLFRFNGFSVAINDAGEGTIQFNGKTNADNSLHDEANVDASGSNINFSRDGSIFIGTQLNKELIALNHEKNRIDIQVDEGGYIFMESGGVYVGNATDAWMLGTTYRQAQKSLNNDIVSQLTEISGKLAEVAGYLSVAGTAMTTPISGPVVASPLIVNASNALAAVVPKIVKIASKITKFESRPDDYLSSKNYND